MLTSNTVTALDAAQHDGTETSPARVLAGDRASTLGSGALQVRGANDEWIPVHNGDWVVKYTEDDLGVYAAGEYQRHFGSPAQSPDA